MAKEASQRINNLLNTAAQLNQQGQRRDALDLCDAAMTIAHAANIDCTQINNQRNVMMGNVGRVNPNVRDLR